jgi:mono/diheme cytochrome c family protein
MFKKFVLPLAVACALALSATTHAENDDSNKNRNQPTPINPSPIPIPTPGMTNQGRLLASNCFQCHGTNGSGGFERIAGEAGEIREFRSKIASKDIMAAHAQGYTDAQIEALVSYLNQLR